MDTDKSLVPEPGPYELEITIEKLKKYKSSGTDQILAELTQEGSDTLCFDIHKLIYFCLE
jgi:hypothetical protein